MGEGRCNPFCCLLTPIYTHRPFFFWFALNFAYPPIYLPIYTRTGCSSPCSSRARRGATSSPSTSATATPSGWVRTKNRLTDDRSSSSTHTSCRIEGTHTPLSNRPPLNTRPLHPPTTDTLPGMVALSYLLCISLAFFALLAFALAALFCAVRRPSPPPVLYGPNCCCWWW